MNQHPDNLRSVFIVGGGTAGWLCAAVLRAYLPAESLEISVLESPDAPTIGVGEATVPALVSLIRRLGIPEDDMMRKCQATWKLGIQFTNWAKNDSSYWHPFGHNGGSIDGLPFFYYWVRRALEGKAEAYTDFSPNGKLSTEHRAPIGINHKSPIYEQGSYAYHLDAALFADYLRSICTSKGVTHITDHVTNVQTGESGIEYITGRDNNTYEAGLYIDCSGFSSLLSGRALEAKRIDWSDQLLCNRAIALSLNNEPDYKPYTTSTALKHGWVWNVPLMHRTGCGYVFSSNHTSDDSAIEALKRHVGMANIKGDPRLIPLHVGRLEKPWTKNCIAIGLAGGFIEPLESTGIYLIQAAIEELLRYFPDKHMNPALADKFNQRVADTYDGVKDFIVLHYLLAERTDNNFWKDSKNIAISDRLTELLDFYDATGMVEKPIATLFPAVSVHTIMAGNNRLPKRPPAQSLRVDNEKLQDIFNQVLQGNQAMSDALPSHTDMLNQLHKPVVYN
jgi:tryptophan 7-halogenase